MKLTGTVQSVSLLGQLDRPDNDPEHKDRQVLLQLHRAEGCIEGSTVKLILPQHLAGAYTPGRRVDVEITPK